MPGKHAIHFDEDEGRTQQYHKDACDVNNIVNRYNDTGVITHLAKKEGKYGFATAQTFSEAAFIVADAKSAFAQQPATIRRHFDNDVAKYLDAAQDPNRRDEFVELGLLEALTPEAQPTATETLAAQAKAAQELADAATLAAQTHAKPSEEASE